MLLVNWRKSLLDESQIETNILLVLIYTAVLGICYSSVKRRFFRFSNVQTEKEEWWIINPWQWNLLQVITSYAYIKHLCYFLFFSFFLQKEIWQFVSFLFKISSVFQLPCHQTDVWLEVVISYFSSNYTLKRGILQLNNTLNMHYERTPSVELIIFLTIKMLN